MSGPRIPGFTYLDHLGSGGFAEVFLYEQEWPRQKVAVKVVRPDVPLNDREKQLFTSEANAMARLADHPYIVSVITAGITDEPGKAARPYLVMRYCPPPDLGARVRTAPMSVVDAISTGIKLASAIETAHRSGILHRDIKPSNVLVTTYNEPALTDFGIAGHMHEVDSDHEVRISYPWSPPELLDGRSNGSVASDVYSLGATIWNLLVGRSPFSVPNGDNSSRGLTARILHAGAPPTQRADVPPALDRLLQQSMAKDPSHRPQSALELARALQRIEAQQNYPRTAIAVEGDTPGLAQSGAPLGQPGAPDPDATHFKPISVVHASGPRGGAVATTAPPAAPPTEAPPTPVRTSTVVWSVVGVVALAAIGVGILLTAGGDDEPGDNPSPGQSSHTPIDIAPEAPEGQPVVTGSRKGNKVTFKWGWPDPLEQGDSWRWRRTDSGDDKRTSGKKATVRANDRVCIQVQLIRGTFASAWTEKCVN